MEDAGQPTKGGSLGMSGAINVQFVVQEHYIELSNRIHTGSAFTNFNWLI